VLKNWITMTILANEMHRDVTRLEVDPSRTRDIVPVNRKI